MFNRKTTATAAAALSAISLAAVGITDGILSLGEEPVPVTRDGLTEEQFKEIFSKVAALEEHAGALLDSAPLEEYGVDRELLGNLDRTEQERLLVYAILLQHEHPVARKFASSQIEQMMNVAAPVQEGLRRALSDPERDVRSKAAETLVDLHDQLSAESCHSLLEYILKDKKGPGPSAAGRALSYRDSVPFGEAELAQILEFIGAQPDGVYSPVDELVTVVGTMGAAAEGGIPVLKDMAENGDSFFIRSNAIKSLSQLGVENDQLAGLLVEAIKEHNYFSETTLAEFVGEMGAEGAPLVDVLLPMVRETELQSDSFYMELGKIFGDISPDGSKIVRKFATDHLVNGDNEERLRAAMVLANMESGDLQFGVALLEGIIRSERYSNRDRLRAISSLTQVGEEGQQYVDTDLLLSIADGKVFNLSPGPKAREWAVTSLRHHGYRGDTVETLARLSLTKGDLCISDWHSGPGYSAQSLVYLYSVMPDSSENRLRREDLVEKVIDSLEASNQWNSFYTLAAIEKFAPELLENDRISDMAPGIRTRYREHHGSERLRKLNLKRSVASQFEYRGRLES